MKRRNFIGSLAALMCGAVAGCRCSTSLKAEEWGKEPVDMVFINGKWTTDPFIKIYLIDRESIEYKNITCTQCNLAGSTRGDDYTVIMIDYNYEIYKQMNCLHKDVIPAEYKDKQKTKEEFYKEVEQFYKHTLNPGLKYELVEFVCDNGKSNLFAFVAEV